MPGMLDGDASYEFLSGVEDSFGPQIYGKDVARLRPAKHFVEAGDAEIEPSRLHLPRTPLTEEEANRILADWAIKESSGEYDL